MTRKNILTPAQEDIMRCVMQGMSVRETAETLGQTFSTVKKQQYLIRKHLSSKTMAQATVTWIVSQAALSVERDKAAKKQLTTKTATSPQWNQEFVTNRVAEQLLKEAKQAIRERHQHGH